MVYANHPVCFSESPRFCKWDTFRAKCPAGSVIIMEEVLYGRMANGKCIEKDFGYVGCKNDVLDIGKFIHFFPSHLYAECGLDHGG